MLWIALYLPQLALQLVQRIGTPDLHAASSCMEGPCVIADGPMLRPLVFCANDGARERGIKPGMPLAAARALSGSLTVLPRDTRAEAQALRNLACWASQFTPGLVIQEGDGLLLEVSSVLTLHGGLSRLLIRIGQGIKELGYQVEPGVAPTAIASWLLAKARHARLPVRMCRDAALLPQRLAPLPMSLLDWPIEELNKLNALGIRRIGDCMKLPRDGFIRRFGAERRLELDRMLGLEADPRLWFTLPDHFSSTIEFGFEVKEALMLAFPLKRLLQELEGFLRGRGAGVQHWQLKLEHMSHRSSTLDMRVLAPERSAERFLALAREKLAQVTLEGPVLGISLVATELLEFEENNRTLIPDPRSRALGWGQLVDRLAARLGNERLYRLRAVDDHRPEQAWKEAVPHAGSTENRQQGRVARSTRAQDGEGNPAPAAPRPLWLLRTPRTLLSDNDEPLCQGRLRMVAGPERIESGWWDGNSARRDYYVARNGKGETFWIYREHRRSKDWYLHGIFS